MPTVTVKNNFIGTPEEVSKSGGQIPVDMKNMESKMSHGEKSTFKGIITRGTIMEVSEQRKRELLGAGVIEGADEFQKQEKQKEKEERELKQSQEREKQTKVNVTEKQHMTITGKPLQVKE